MWQIINNYIGIVIMTVGIFLFARIILNQNIKITKNKLALIIFFIAIIYTIIYMNFIGMLKTIIIFL